MKNVTRKIPMKLQWFAEDNSTDQTTGTATEQNTEDSATATEEHPTTNAQQSANNAATNTEKTFTQAEVKAMMTREKREGKNSVLNKFKELGLDEGGVEKLVSLLKTTTQPAEISHEQIQQKQELLSAQVRAELALNGVKSGAVDDMEILVAHSLDPMSYTKDDIADAIKDIKTRHQNNFGVDATANNNSNQSKTGTGTPYGSTSTESFFGKRDGSFGRELAKSLKG